MSTLPHPVRYSLVLGDLVEAARETLARPLVEKECSRCLQAGYPCVEAGGD